MCSVQVPTLWPNAEMPSDPRSPEVACSLLLEPSIQSSQKLYFGQRVLFRGS